MGKVFHSKENQQINYMDERFYTKDGVTFYPSVTTVLGVYPKGYGFNKWLKENGEQADEILKEAGDSGSKVHDAVDRIIKGEEIRWTYMFLDTLHLQSHESIEQYYKDVQEGQQSKYYKEVAIYSLEEWLMILRFVDFCNTYKPRFIANEFSVISDHMKTGGTIDIVCDIDMMAGKTMITKRYLIDTKTSNYLHKTHELQLAAYATMFNELNPDMIINGTGILWLKSQTRGPDKTGKSIQGAGWQLKEYDRPYEDAYKLYRHVRAIWDEENVNYKPKNLIYPDRIKLG